VYRADSYIAAPESTRIIVAITLPSIAGRADRDMIRGTNFLLRQPSAQRKFLTRGRHFMRQLRDRLRVWIGHRRRVEFSVRH